MPPKGVEAVWKRMAMGSGLRWKGWIPVENVVVEAIACLT
jgi:hypothetical protein